MRADECASSVEGGQYSVLCTIRFHENEYSSHVPPDNPVNQSCKTRKVDMGKSEDANRVAMAWTSCSYRYATLIQMTLAIGARDVTIVPCYVGCHGDRMIEIVGEILLSCTRLLLLRGDWLLLGEARSGAAAMVHGIGII